jgi:hypothetical protein
MRTKNWALLVLGFVLFGLCAAGPASGKEGADIEPSALTIAHCNGSFTEARVDLRTVAGSRSGSFTLALYDWGKSRWSDHEIELKNPGRMREGWTLTLTLKSGHVFVYKSTRTGSRSTLSISLVIDSTSKKPALRLNGVGGAGGDLVLLPEK